MLQVHYDKYDGYGKLYDKYDNKLKYEGEFKNNIYNGNGKLYNTDDGYLIYEGEVIDGIYNIKNVLIKKIQGFGQRVLRDFYTETYVPQIHYYLHLSLVPFG